MRAMSRVPLDPLWIASIPAFDAPEGRIVSAALKLLLAAWHHVPAGAVPHSIQAIASICSITEDEARKWRPILMAGWDVRGDLIVFHPMEKLGARMHKHYRQHIEALEDGMGLSGCAPDLFGTQLIPNDDRVSSLTSRLAGRRKLPDGAGLTSEMKEFLLEAGFSHQNHEGIWAGFEDFAKAKDFRFSDWASAFRNWVRQNITWGHIVPDMPSSQSSTARPRANIRLASTQNRSDDVSRSALASLQRVNGNRG